MFRNSPCTRSLRRYVRLLLEELECRYVPSLMGLQIELPLSGIVAPLPISVGNGFSMGHGAAATHAPMSSASTIATTSPQTTTFPGTTTTSPEIEIITITFTPAGASNSSFAPTTGSTTGPTTGPTSGVSQVPVSSTQGAEPVSSSSGFSEGPSQGSGGAFAFPGSAPAASVPGLAIQAFSASSSTVLGGAAGGVNVQLLGNMMWLQGQANVAQGTTNTVLSPSSLNGAPLAGSLFTRPDLFTDRTTGERSARGLSHPAPGDREEQLPEQFLLPPDEDWFEPVPQNIEQSIPGGDVLFRLRDNLPVSFLKIVPPKTDAVNPPLFDALPDQLPQGFMLSDEEAVLPDDEEQPEEERSGMSAAVAIISFGAGAYWTIRDSRTRRTAVDLPVSDEAR